jgi:hypothetical protein
MNEARRIVSVGVFAAAMLLMAQSVAAQVSVTPTVKPTPPGQLIVVNNSPGANHTDPHVDGDLVCYTYQPSRELSTIRYHNLATGTDNGVPAAPGALDFLCDVRGTTIIFTRDGSNASILTFDTASSTLTEIAPQPNATRFGGQISDQTIAWQDFCVPACSTTSAAIVAYDRTSGTTTAISPTSAPVINQNPGISSDGNVVVWEGCTGATSCVIWKAIRSSAGAWNSQQLVSQVGAAQSHPDTDGTIIAYASRSSTTTYIAWQPAAGGTEQVLSIPGSAINPSVSGGVIVFNYDATGSGLNYQIALYDTRSNFLYNLSADANPNDTNDTDLNDVSVTPDGKVRVVWQERPFNGGQWNLIAYTFNLPVGDFNLGAISPLTIAAGGSGSTNVSVNAVNGFSSAVSLSVTGQPAGVTATLTPNSVTPSGGSAANSVLNVSLPPLITPTSFTLTVVGNSGALSHSAIAEVTVTTTESSIGNLIGDLLGAGCIDNAGIGNALTSKLSAAQSAGNAQTAINTLTALKNQINAQAGKHIATSCTIAGVTFNPVTALLLDVQGLIDSLRVSMTPDPITGYVVDMNGVGVPGAAVSILDANGNTVATAMTDITGFYFIATTGGVLTPGASYTLQVSGLPAGFSTATPASQPLLWQGAAAAFSNFVLN